MVQEQVAEREEAKDTCRELERQNNQEYEIHHPRLASCSFQQRCRVHEGVHKDREEKKPMPLRESEIYLRLQGHAR